MAVVVIVVLVAMFMQLAGHQPGASTGSSCSDDVPRRCCEGLYKGTLIGTVGAMVIGVVLGILMAVMRLSGNPVLRGVALAYMWFFRAMPRYVL